MKDRLFKVVFELRDIEMIALVYLSEVRKMKFRGGAGRRRLKKTINILV